MSEDDLVELKIECTATNPPKPVGIGIFVAGTLLYSISIEQFKLVADRLRKLEKRT